MRSPLGLLILGLSLSACSNVKSVQLRPPVAVPSDLAWGYGVDKDPATAYHKALDHLLYPGPVVVSKPVQAAFVRRAEQELQPSLKQEGTKDGLAWVLIRTSQDEIERVWRQFSEWREARIDEAGRLYREASGPNRLDVLNAAASMLEDAGAQDDSGFYDDIVADITLADRLRSLIDSGQLLAADQVLDQAQSAGFDSALDQQYRMEIIERRKQALNDMLAGDELFRQQRYKEALGKYDDAQVLDRDNPQIAERIATAQEQQQVMHSAKESMTVSVIGLGARILGSYLDGKREDDRRKREEAARAQKKKEKEAQKKEKEKEKAKQKQAAPTPSPQPESTSELPQGRDRKKP